MSYKFKLSEGFQQGLHRIADEQTQRALQCLQAEGDVHRDVHEARKTFKKLRALLSLYRDVLDEADYRDLDHGYRDIARSLAKTRESQALLDSLDLLEHRFQITGRKGRAVKLRAVLQQRLSETAGHAGLSTSTVAATIRDLASAVERIKAIRIETDDFGSISAGIERTYRGARRWHRKAYALEPGDIADSETFHEWRKHLQRHWRHMQLLTPAWPHDMRQRAQLAHKISEVIGQEHDLSALEALLAASGRAFGSLAQASRYRSLCRELQGELRASVQADGRRLFLENPKAFTKRVQRYWEEEARDTGVTNTPALLPEPT